MEIQNTNNAKQSYIKILVHGASGSGKTRLCATTGGTALVINAEQGLLSLRDENIDFVTVKSMADIYEIYNFLLTNTKYDWVCIDSISEIAEVLLSEEKAKTKDPRQAYGEMQEVIIKLVRTFRDLPKNMYFIAKQEHIKDEITGGFLYGPSAPGKKVGSALPYLFDEVFALHAWKDNEGKEQNGLQTKRDAQFDAKDRSGALEFVEVANLGEICAKILTKINNNETLTTIGE